MKQLSVRILLSLVWLQLSWAQEPSQAQAPQPGIKIANRAAKAKPIPPHLLYRHFLNWAADLDKAANTAGISDPYKFAEPFAKDAGLEERHLDAIRVEAKSLEKDLKVQDGKAAALVAEFRASGKEALLRGEPLPPLPAQLKELQQERDTLIQSHISVLRAALGPEVSIKLDQYLSRDFAPHVSLTAIAVPGPKGKIPVRK